MHTSHSRFASASFTKLLVSLSIAAATACGQVEPAEGPDPEPTLDPSAPDAAPGAERAGSVVAEQSSYELGDVFLGKEISRALTLRNAGEGATAALSVKLGGEAAADYTLDGGTCAGAALAAGATCDLTIKLRPSALGRRRASLTIEHGAAAPVAVALAGVGVEPTHFDLTASNGRHGTVKSAAGIDCGPTCAMSVARGTTITLTVVADDDHEHIGWTGCDSGNALVCTVTMNGARHVEPIYVRLRELIVTGTSTEHAVNAGTTIQCGKGKSTCRAMLREGTELKLIADALTGHEVKSWTNCKANASKSTCLVAMTHDLVVHVTFGKVVD